MPSRPLQIRGRCDITTRHLEQKRAQNKNSIPYNWRLVDLAQHSTPSEVLPVQ